MPDNQEKNNGRWKPGQSGNPAGRPKGTIGLTEAIRRRLESLGPDQKRAVMEQLADNMVQDALEGGKYGTKMRELIYHYLEGMPRQQINATVLMPKPLDDVSEDNSVQEDQSDAEENQGDTGGNSGQQDGFDNSVSDSASPER